ncbi:MAG TPA: outer membrane protein transport protein [Rhodanobacteraceae bacterium]|nr:outer membrane protein transport protein [Rhodanobacteraceae bacterium]
MTPTRIDARRNAPALALATLALAIAGVLAASGAQASGFQLKENSAKALGRSFAGSLAAPGDVSVVVNNPAAMSDLQGVYFKADMTVINFSTKFTGSGHDVTGAPLTGGNGGEGGLTMPVPAIFFATPVGEYSHFGAAVTVPYGFTTEYDKDWIGRYKAVKSKLQTVDLTLSYSYAVTNSLSLGGSVVMQHTSADLTSMVDYGTFLGVPQKHDGLARITGSATDYGWQLGALWKVGQHDRLAINYRAKIDHTLKGNATFHDVPTQLAALVELGNFQNTKGSAEFATPSTLGVSWWHEATDRLSFGVNAARTDWTSFKELRVKYGSGQDDTVEPENWKATWAASLGGDYKLNSKWTLRAGVAVDRSPTSDATRTPRVPDANRRWLSFGFDYTPSADFELNVGFAHLWVDDAHVDNEGITGGPTGSTLAGYSKNSGNLLGVSGTFRF